MTGKMSFSAVGDYLPLRRLPAERYEGFEEIAAEIQKAEVRFFNLETTLHNFETYCSQYHGGNYLCSPPEVLDDAKSFGFNITSFCNNHTLDWSYGGVERTIENLAKASMPHAGVGMDMQKAEAPAYLDCYSGRVALISATSTFNPAAMAGNASRAVIGRPGVNGLRLITTYYIEAKHAETFREIAEATKINAAREMSRSEGFKPPLPENIMEFDTLLFSVSDRAGKETKVHPEDMKRIERTIYDAAMQTDYIIISIHCHEMRDKEKNVPDEFLEDFAHKCIDAGAHAVIGHGPHTLRAIEIYKDRPIFYSLGDFVIHNENTPKSPADYFEFYGLPADATMRELFLSRSANYTRGLSIKREVYETVIPYWEMEDGKLTKLTLLAAELGFDLPRSRSGWPAPAKDSSILEGLEKLSAPFNVSFRIKGNRAEVIL